MLAVTSFALISGAVLLTVAFGLFAGTLMASEAPVRCVTMRADKAFDEGQGATGVKRRSDPAGGVMLYDHLLIEDDAPGMSSTSVWLKENRAPITMLGGKVKIKKILHVERVGGLEARLYVPLGSAVEVNGRAVATPRNTEYPIIPMELLKKGANEIVVSGRGGGQEIKLATNERILANNPERADRLGRSFISRDGGENWESVDGEYMVRLHLKQYATEGSMLSPLIDMAGSSAAGPLAGQVTVGRLKAELDGQSPQGTSIELLLRSGSSPVVDSQHWSDWQQADGASAPQGHRYVQWRAVLRSDDPALTPVLHGVTLEAPELQVAQLPQWASENLTLGDVRNDEICFTSIPFEYEDPNHPRMVALRKKYKLDEVVAGAESELEKMVRLRHWVATRWKYNPPTEFYPPWDADAIISNKIGFCVQYAITFTQCAISLGYQARFVFGNHYGVGHEVSEFWSNELQKWVMMDISKDMHHVDAATGEPLSMLELHDLIIRECYGDNPAIIGNLPKGEVTTDKLKSCYELQMTPEKPKKPTSDGRFLLPMQWMHLRWMPRNNFYARPTPLPICQGAHWDWADFIVLDDPQMPLEYRYRYYTSRRSDFDWTLNQVRFDLACDKEPNVLKVQMGTVTPYFETFLVQSGEGRWTECGNNYQWHLERGVNRLQMRVRNSSGVLGPVSSVVVEMKH